MTSFDEEDDKTSTNELNLRSPAVNEQEEACLVVLSAAKSVPLGTVIPLNGRETVLGRGEGAINIDDDGVSRRHAVVKYQSDGWTVRDLASTNGTFVNEKRVTVGTLRHGDRVRLGSALVQFCLPSHEGDLAELLALGRAAVWNWEAAAQRSRCSPQFSLLAGLGTGNWNVALEDHVSEQDRRFLVHAFSRCTSELDLTVQVNLPGGMHRMFQVTGEALKDSTGATTRLFGTLVDVTHQLRSKEELRRQCLTFECLHEGVVVCDPDGRVVDWNAAATALFGRSKSEVLGQDLLAVLGAQGQGAARAVLDQAEVSGRLSREWTLTHANGSSVLCETVIVPLRDADAVLLGFVAASRDVGEHKRMQEQLARADRLAAVGTLAAGVAHEVNNPLAYIKANLEYLAAAQPGTVPADQSEVIREVLVGVERISTIVKELVVFARTERLEEFEPVSLERVVSVAARMANPEVRHGARLVLDVKPTPRVQAKESRLTQVVLNLLINAAQAIPRGAPEQNEIRVRCWSPDPERAIIEVSDTGKGMDAQLQRRIFEPFFTTKAGQGTGLGLSICHTIVTNLGGEVSVESEPGKGSTFRVTLPVGKPAEARVERPAPVVRGCRLLLVDDEPAVNLALSRFLSQHHEVTAVQSAAEALKLLSLGKLFDAVLCDVMMPGMSGPELCEELKRIDSPLAERVVLMTAGTLDDEGKAPTTSTPWPRLSKPLDFRRLNGLLAELTSSR